MTSGPVVNFSLKCPMLDTTFLTTSAPWLGPTVPTVAISLDRRCKVSQRSQRLLISRVLDTRVRSVDARHVLTRSPSEAEYSDRLFRVCSLPRSNRCANNSDPNQPGSIPMGSKRFPHAHLSRDPRFDVLLHQRRKARSGARG